MTTNQIVARLRGALAHVRHTANRVEAGELDDHDLDQAVAGAYACLESARINGLDVDTQNHYRFQIADAHLGFEEEEPAPRSIRCRACDLATVASRIEDGLCGRCAQLKRRLNVYTDLKLYGAIAEARKIGDVTLITLAEELLEERATPADEAVECLGPRCGALVEPGDEFCSSECHEAFFGGEVELHESLAGAVARAG